MKYQTETHCLESVRRSESVYGGIDVSDWELPSSATHVVRGNIDSKELREFDLDLETIRRRAQAARSAWVAGWLQSTYEAIARKFRKPSDFAAAATILKNAGSKPA